MLNKLLAMLAGVFSTGKSEINVDENQYYSQLFVENAVWNSSDPNEDEQSRWTEIWKMLDSIGSTGCAWRIIDVGCGRGWLSNKLLPYGNVTGIEPVAPVIEYAKTLFKEPRFHAMRPDEFIAAFPNEKFDLVVCSEVLEHVIEKAKFIDDLHNLLIPGGHLVLTTPRGELRTLWETKYGAPPQPIEEWISTSNLLRLLQDSGFVVLKSSTAFSEGIYQIHLAGRKE